MNVCRYFKRKVFFILKGKCFDWSRIAIKTLNLIPWPSCSLVSRSIIHLSGFHVLKSIVFSFYQPHQTSTDTSISSDFTWTLLGSQEFLWADQFLYKVHVFIGCYSNWLTRASSSFHWPILLKSLQKSLSRTQYQFFWHVLFT